MWTFGKKVAAGFALSFVLLVGVGVVAYQSITALAKTSYAVTHTHVVLEHLTSVLGLLKDAETGQRGFVITGDEAYLEPYRGAVDALPGTLGDLRDLLSDSASQEKRLDELEPLVTLKMAELKQTVDLRRTGGFESAVAVVRGGEGKKTMDQVRHVVDRDRSRSARAAPGARRGGRRVRRGRPIDPSRGNVARSPARHGRRHRHHAVARDPDRIGRSARTAAPRPSCKRRPTSKWPAPRSRRRP